MVNVNVLDVIGPLPVENSCFVVASAGEKIFAIQCTYADAEMCHGLLRGSPVTNPYEFTADLLEKLKISFVRGELETVNGCIYAKMFLKNSKSTTLMKMVSPNPTAVVNSALANKGPINISDDMVIKLWDATVEYHRIKGAIGSLFPLPELTNTDILRLMSEFVDKIQFRHASIV